MTENQYNKIVDKIIDEINIFKDRKLSLRKDIIYDSFYEIHAHEEIYNYIRNYGLKMDYRGFPKKHIIEDFYEKFMKTDFSLTQRDLDDFFDYAIAENIKKQQEIQM